jgi:MFS family permease
VTAAAIIVAFHALALFVEAPLLAKSERYSARSMSIASLAVIAASSIIAALARGAFALALSLAIYGPAAGILLATAEGALVESQPTQRERTMARLGFSAALGDLAVPALLAVLAAFRLGWRAAMFATAIASTILALLHASSRSTVPAVRSDDEEPEPIVASLRLAWRTKPLLVWSMAGVLTSLLDEVFVAFASNHLDAMRAGASARSIAIGAWIAGGLATFAIYERRGRTEHSKRWMLGSSAATLAGLASLAITRAPIVAIAACAVIGAGTALLHPLTKAQAYASLPGRPGLVNAVASTFVAFELAAPIALAWIAYMGPAHAIAALAIAPIGIACATMFYARRNEVRRSTTHRRANAVPKPEARSP